MCPDALLSQARSHFVFEFHCEQVDTTEEGGSNWKEEVKNQLHSTKPGEEASVKPGRDGPVVCSSTSE